MSAVGALLVCRCVTMDIQKQDMVFYRQLSLDETPLAIVKRD